jgi:hypothetical protein
MAGGAFFQLPTEGCKTSTSPAVGGSAFAASTREAIVEMNTFPIRLNFGLFIRGIGVAAQIAALSTINIGAAQTKLPAPAPNPDQDVLILSNGDALHGKFVSETAGKVTFHSDPLGDVSVTWDKIKEMHVSEKFGVLSSTVHLKRGKNAIEIPNGSIDVANEAVTVHPANAPEVAPIPVKNAQFIMDSATLDKEINHQPNFFAGWNGAATAGATIVSATTDQYTFNGAVNLARAIPTASWLDARDKTLFAFNESYGKITQPAYTYLATPPATGTVAVPAVVTKSSITHVGAERDEYISARVYALGQVAFDHNYAQDLQLQQIYGGGFGWTMVKSPKQEFDLKGTVQYEKQQFEPGTGNVNQNLIGSTFAGNYVLHLKLLTYTQGLSFIPAYNNFKAYSANEINTVAFPAYKNFSFSEGTVDTYLNNAPFTATASNPPTKPNSFQFTMGATYNIKSKY